jgi:Secretion system C-terminal sorting domain
MIIIIGLLLLVMASTTYANTFISGEITQTEFNTEGSPYILLDSCYVPLGNSLSVQPGTIIKGHTNGFLWITGEIICNGTADNEILFTSVDDSESWIGISIYYSSGSSYFDHVIIENGRNRLFCGGGLTIRESDVTVKNSVFRHNTSGQNSGGIYALDANVSITYSTFYDNYAVNYGAAVGFAEGNQIEFAYNLVYSNYSGGGGAVYYYQGNHEVDHCTIVDNMSQSMYPDFLHESGVITIDNSIIWNNGPTELQSSSIILSYSCVSADINGTNLIYDDPLFVNPSVYDYRLMPMSPCINAGDPSFPLDLDGSVTDIGALGTGGIAPPPGDVDMVVLPEIAVLAGNDYVIPLLCGPMSNDDIISFQGKILLPGDIIESVNEISFLSGGFFEESWLLETNVIGDTVLFSMAGSNPFAGSQPLIQINVSISDLAEMGTYSLEWIELIANEDAAILTPVNGSITVTDFQLGDVSMNSTIQAFDAALIMSHLDTSVPLELIQIQLGEVSGDNELSALDVSLILQKVSGLIDEFPAESQIQIRGSGNVEYPLSAESSTDEFTIHFDIDELQDVSSLIIDLVYDTNEIEITSIENIFDNGIYAIEPTAIGSKIHLAFNSSISLTNSELFELHLSGANLQNEFIQVKSMRFNDYGYDLSNHSIRLSNATSVNEVNLPQEFEFMGSYPNPFNSMTNIRYRISENQNVKIEIVNLLGQIVEVLSPATTMVAGEHSISWQATNAPAGIYFVKVNSGNKIHITKIMLLK